MPMHEAGSDTPETPAIFIQWLGACTKKEACVGMETILGRGRSIRGGAMVLGV